ncbi:isocitrate lyase/PEP mutase family protein [Vibrio nitrifigilis]|uniref:Isocitrate lyase/phosphoenolpyruvate mutase family protein n=1 Tax=Vibrio nitrifigilis TaxID=2789781 RepID=A0ABS0GJA9_9VIBR|nr:isocitrate lyase/phosphoenolpyruvate mutase family protein [Vibrio nitrifigilis]MBF9002427.1 isocitrate lyase/phosphoenolpyruvate mutase family protein [Vibrio nitrifigilis]
MFKNMHEMEELLVIGNVWDVPSAKIAESVGFSVIGTSSAAIAKNLGKEDGENIRFEDLLSIVKAIAKSTELPLTVDLESGYGETPEIIAKNIMELVKIGVVGVNIEDSVVLDGERSLCDSALFGKILEKVRKYISEADLEIFINVRSDVFLLNVEDPLETSIERIDCYQQAGADGIFLPCISKQEDIRSVVDSTSLPINVMCLPGLPSFSELKTLGVKRISMGNFVHEAMLASLASTLASVKREQSFDTLFI